MRRLVEASRVRILRLSVAGPGGLVESRPELHMELVMTTRGCSWIPLATRRLIPSWRSPHRTPRISPRTRGAPDRMYRLPPGSLQTYRPSSTKRVTGDRGGDRLRQLRRRGLDAALASSGQPGRAAHELGRPADREDRARGRLNSAGSVWRPPGGASSRYAALRHEVARAAAILPRYQLHIRGGRAAPQQDRCDGRDRRKGARAAPRPPGLDANVAPGGRKRNGPLSDPCRARAGRPEARRGPTRRPCATLRGGPRTAYFSDFRRNPPSRLEEG